MPRRYGTRSATKVARSSKAIEKSSTTAAAPPVAPRRGGDSTNAFCCGLSNTTSNRGPEKAAGASTSGDNEGPKPLSPPPSLHLTGNGGKQRAKAPLPPARDGCGPARAAPASASLRPVVVAAQIGAENLSTGGGSGGDRPRKRSRLSLGKHRVSPPQQQTGVASRALAPIGETKGEGSGAVVGCFPGGVWPRLSEGQIGGARGSPPDAPRSSPTPPPPPPPFVGLKNMGETCYVNAVLQSLAACREALKSKNEAAGAAGESKGLGPPPATPTAEGSSPGSAGAATAGAGAGTDGNPVFYAVGRLLREMESCNRALLRQQSLAAPPPGHMALTPPALSAQGPSDPENSASVAPPGERTPRLRPGVAMTQDLTQDPRPVVITPTAFVELIREGWLSAERSAGGAAAGRLRFGGGTAGPTAAVADFGTGQACVSELLGKVIDVDAALHGDGGGRGGARRTGCVVDGERGSVENGVRGLARAFRGALCARTVCVECERDRSSREEFTELTLPPLAPPPPPSQPSPRHAATQGEAAGGTRRGGGGHESTPKKQTLQGLVDAVVSGRESLGGSNKLWCEACRQWNEAERRSSLCSPPALLALHVRPGERKRSSPCPYPAAAMVAAASVGARVGRGGTNGETERERSEEREGGADGGELVERVLVVKGAARCRFHDLASALAPPGKDDSSGISVGKAQPPQSSPGGGEPHHHHRHHRRDAKQHRQPSGPGDVLYDLVGAILHQGQTLGSGHYTFALHAGGCTSSSKDEPPANPPAGDVSRAAGGKEHAATSPGESGREGRGLPSVRGSAMESGAGGRTGDATPSFALFDDAVVRWLSLEEELAVLRGSGGGLGDPFLVFYSRRA